MEVSDSVDAALDERLFIESWNYDRKLQCAILDQPAQQGWGLTLSKSIPDVVMITSTRRSDKASDRDERPVERREEGTIRATFAVYSLSNLATRFPILPRNDG